VVAIAVDTKPKRYRVDVAPLPNLRRRADVVFGPARVALFIDGCFWHGCPEHGSRRTTANTQYWSTKVERNQARDRDTDERLRAAGWLPLRVWEHEEPEAVAARVTEAVRGRHRQPPIRTPARTPDSSSRRSGHRAGNPSNPNV
jgi:DNA mismatch endonuclease (patch repair protein)